MLFHYNKIKDNQNFCRIIIYFLTLPLIKTFYKETETYERTNEIIDNLLKHSYYGLIQGNQLFLASLFLQQYIGVGEDNEKHLCELFNNERTRDSFLKKLSAIPKDY